MKSTVNAFKTIMRSELPYWCYAKVLTMIQPYRDDTFEATEILPGFWLGDIRSCSNSDHMKEHDIDVIISCYLGCSATFPYDFKYEKADLRDIENENILDDIERLVPDIHKYLNEKQSVLVHCIAGRSRSTSVVAAYLMKYKNMSKDEALEFIKDKRSCIKPNEGYLNQLSEYEERCNAERNMNDVIENVEKNENGVIEMEGKKYV